MDTARNCSSVVEIRLTGFRSINLDDLVVHWLVNDGDYVEMGDPICEVEAAKSSVNQEAPEDGIIAIRPADVVMYDLKREVHPYAIIATIETPADALVIR